MDEQAELCRLFTEEAVKFIEKNKDKPFFCYAPHAFVHGPRRARPEFMAKAKTVEEAQVEECDWSAGQILDAVRKAGIEKDTFVLFTSDNGGARGLTSGPLRGGKGSMWEGGFRGPTVAWWPGTIPAGSTCKEMTTTMDLLPTFAKWAGGKVPADRVIDGKVASDLYLGKEGAKTPHDRFFFNARNTLRAVRSGPWKLFLNGPLHNLEENLGETKNYASERPGVVKRLKGYAARFEKDLKKNSRPVGVAKNPRTLVPRPGVEGRRLTSRLCGSGNRRTELSMDRTIKMNKLILALAFVFAGCSTQIHYAVRNGDTERVKELLDSGSDVNARDSSQESELFKGEKRLAFTPCIGLVTSAIRKWSSC